MKKCCEKFINSSLDIYALKISVILIFALFGTYKWFEFEAKALETIFTTTWMRIFYDILGLRGATIFLGVVENITMLLLLIGFKKPKAGVLGDFLVIVTGITTLSLMPQLHKIDSFIVKDILLIGAGLVMLKYDFLKIQKE